MVTDHLQNKAQQRAPEIFTAPAAGSKRATTDRKRILRRRLNEVILGRRPALRLYSKTLKSDCWFVNEGLVTPEYTAMPGKVITMEMLADLMNGDESLDHVLRHLLNDAADAEG